MPPGAWATPCRPAASESARDGAACAGPWPRSGGCAHESRQSACRPPPGCAVGEPKAELDHAPLAWDKGIEGGLDRKLEHGDRGGVRGGRGLLVLDEIAELGILFMADRWLQ